MLTRKLAPFAILLCILAVACVYAVSARADVNFTDQTQTANYQNFSFFNATTTTATSTNLSGGGGYFKIAGAKKVELYFSRGGATGPNTGSTLFKVQVTPDGTNWYDFNKLEQNLATSTTATKVASVSIAAATSTTVTSMDLRTDAFYGVRCIAVETTDGEHTCAASAEF